ncbi:RNA-binding protein [Listeriaceae bacterium FSL A5-0209]|nr:RNA-binding protein [Listeria newyorkensis]KGL45773.1 RNA-binding protein [Listeriaceae bacterium FSL A5-0209]KMT58268.1 S4-like RNA binding protein [Listeria newyorkensis]
MDVKKMAESIKINTEYITLGQLLQMMDVISSGGMAKAFLSENMVYINGEEDNRRGRKLRNGDVVLVPGEGKVQIQQG